jgi:hypothetical protein
MGRIRSKGITTMQTLSEPCHLHLIGAGISLITLTATAINVYVGLRLAALQARIKAEESQLEASLVKQSVGWKDDVLTAINRKHVTATLVAEMRANFGAAQELLFPIGRGDRVVPLWEG